MEELFSFLNSVAEAEGWPQSAACLAHLKEISKTTTLKRKELLLPAGQICANLYFIQKGLLKCYTTP